MLSGCGRKSPAPGEAANISYRQVGICKELETSTGPMKSKDDEGYAFFKFETIENKSTVPFNFDPKLLFVDQSTPEEHAKQVWEWNRRYATVDKRFSQLGISMAPEATVPAGGKVDLNGFVVVPLGVNNPSGGPEEDKYAFDVVYDSMHSENTASGEIRISEGINFVKKNAADKKWTVAENCKDLKL
jgi:hypothetical protein